MTYNENPKVTDVQTLNVIGVKIQEVMLIKINREPLKGVKITEITTIEIKIGTILQMSLVIRPDIEINKLKVGNKTFSAFRFG